MNKVYATIENVKYGETAMGTGPHGGNSGDQWICDITISDSSKHYSKTLKTYKQCIIKMDLSSEEIPSQKDLINICKEKIKIFKDEWPKELAILKEEQNNREKKRKMENKLYRIARNIIVSE